MLDNTRLSNIDYAIASYLQTASAPTIHVALQSLKQSYFVATADVIKNNPETEKATALLLYWKMRPRMVKQLMQTASTDAQLNAFAEQYKEILLDLETKYLSGFYVSKTIGYNPYYDYIKDSEYSGKIPAEMFIAVSGEEIVPVMYDMKQQLTNGLPKDLYRQIADGTIGNKAVKEEVPLEVAPITQPAVRDLQVSQTEVVQDEPIHAITESAKMELSSPDDIFEILTQEVITYIKTAPPEVIHMILRSPVLDENCYVSSIVAYVKDQPETEKATALLMYWLLCPAFSKQFISAEDARGAELDEFDAPHYNLVADLEQKYLSNFYTRQTIGISDFKSFTDDSDIPETAKSRIPPIMHIPIIGKELNEKELEEQYNLIDGLPKFVHDRYSYLLLSGIKSRYDALDEKQKAAIVNENGGSSKSTLITADQIDLSEISCQEDILKVMDVVVIDYLKTADPKVIHLMLRSYVNQYCHLTAIVDYLKDQPETEKATALLMYWLLCPVFSKQFASAEEAKEAELTEFGVVHYDLIADLEQKYLSNFYTRQTIAIDDFEDFQDIDIPANKAKSLLIPKAMRAPVIGTKINEDKLETQYNLFDGIPMFIIDQYDTMNTALEKKDVKRLVDQFGSIIEKTESKKKMFYDDLPWLMGFVILVAIFTEQFSSFFLLVFLSLYCLWARVTRKSISSFVKEKFGKP